MAEDIPLEMPHEPVPMDVPLSAAEENEVVLEDR